MNPINKVTKNFGENVKYLRQLRKYTRQQLADKLGIATVTLAGYETGIRAPSLEKLILIADFFGVSIDSLFSRDEFLKRELEEKNLEQRFERIKNLLTILGMVIHEIKNSPIMEFTVDLDDEFFLRNSEYSVLNKDEVRYGLMFDNKKGLVATFELFERKAARENKTFKDVILETTEFKVWLDISKEEKNKKDNSAK